MNHHRAALDAAKEFLEFVRSSEKPTLRGLAMRLDTLATLMWPLEDDPFDTPTRPHESYTAWYKAIGPRFPMLGSYACPPPKTEDPTPRETSVGDAVDDLADICLDCEAALWVERQVDAKDGAEHLCWLYWVHWQEHLRGLQYHLFDIMRP
jgi:hypothetical protein